MAAENSEYRQAFRRIVRCVELTYLDFFTIKRLDSVAQLQRIKI